MAPKLILMFTQNDVTVPNGSYRDNVAAVLTKLGKKV